MVYAMDPLGDAKRLREVGRSGRASSLPELPSWPSQARLMP
jgi:hypothetical protein